MIPSRHSLDFYATPAGVTSAPRHAELLAALPDDPIAIVRVIPGLIVHEYLASAYGVRVSDERKEESHVRPVERLLDRIVELDSRPLDIARQPAKRLIGICRHFEVLLLTFLRAKGIPARARRGFGAYFDPKMAVDHEITEFWNAAESRWQRVDPQLDQVQRDTLRVTFDPLEVPADQFLTASIAWQRCRVGTADPDHFGIMHLKGLWFVAGNLIRDVAWLNKHEMLPWDVWGAMPQPDEALGADELAFFDQLANLTSDPDIHFDELRDLYEHDDRVRVSGRVFNSKLAREDVVEEEVLL